MSYDKTYTIWSEGYSTTGSSGTALSHGFSAGETFEDACIDKFADNEYYNQERNTLWGCRLFDNQRDARRTFG
jgi:hypothetical protein